MKNILKRGTSLLLVVAMMLSFAVAVGAEDTTSTSPMTLRVGDVPLEAGKEALVPVYATIAAGVQITYLDLAVSCDTGVTIKGMEDRIATGGYDASGRPAYNDGELKYLGGNIENHFLEDGKLYKIGWIAQSGAWLTTTNSPLFWIRVEATTDTPVGGYEIKLGANPSAAEVGKVFGVNDENSEDGVHHYGESDTKVEDGAAIVYDTLPMVALTKTTFDVPTMEDVQTNPGASNYKVADYLKIVADVNGEVKLLDVDADSLTWSTSLNKVNTTATHLSFRTETEDGPATLTVSNVTSTDKSASINGEKTLSFTVNKAKPVATYVGFGTSAGYVAPTNFAGPYSVPSYTEAGTKSKVVELNPGVYDQYGKKLNAAKTRLALYNGDPNKGGQLLDGQDEAYSMISMGDFSLMGSSHLKQDVWCTVTAYTAEKEGDSATFLIKSTKPRATSAAIVLTGDITNNTVEVPVGEATKTVNISATVYDQKNGVMDGVTYTVKAYWGTKDTHGTDIPETGVEASATLQNGVLTITSKALSLLDPTTEKATITVEINVTGISEPVTKTITLTKAQPVATSIGSNNNGSGVISCTYGDSFDLPGIGTPRVVTPIYAVHVLDQYGQIMTDEGTIPAANFKLYPATKNATTSKWEKDPDAVEVDAKYAKFESIPATNGNVQLTLTNEKTASGLALTARGYIVEATYPKGDGTNLTATWGFKMNMGARVPTTATVEAAWDVTVPEKGASEESVNLTATVKDQYGDDVSGVKLSMNGKINAVYKPNGYAIVAFENDQAAGVTNGAFDNVLVLKVSNQLAWYMVEKDMPSNVTSVVTNGELRIPVKITVGEGENAPTFNTTAKVNVSREASALKKATVKMYEAGKTEPVQTVTLTDTDGKTRQKTINMTSPKANTVYTFEIEYEDQYGDETSVNYISYISGANVSPLTHDDTTWDKEKPTATDKIMLTVKKDNVEGETMLEIKPLDGPTWWLNIKFAPMQFVTSADGNTPYTIDQVLGQNSAEYNGTQWLAVVAAATKQDANSTVYIKGETTPISEAQIAIRVLDEKGTVICNLRDAAAASTDLSKNPKADAGEYTVEIVYVKGENDEYEVCHGSFKIEPKEVTITASDIEKTYDGNMDVPRAAVFTLSGKISNDDVDIETGNLVFASKDVKSHLDTETNALVIDDVAIVASKDTNGNELSVLKGDDAGNYTASIAGLKGKITQKALDVYVEFSDKEWDGTVNVWAYTPRFTTPSQIVDKDNVGVNAGVSGDDKPCFSSSDVGATLVSGKTGITATLTGASAGNYEVGNITYGGTSEGKPTITKATLTITRKSGTDATTVYGQDTALANALAVSGYTITNSHGSTIASNAFSNAEAPDGKLTLMKDGSTAQKGTTHYDAGNYTLSLAESGNYEVQNSLDFGIRYIHYTLEPDGTISKEYDGTTALPSSARFKFTTQNTGPSDETLKVKNVEQFAFADANKGDSKTINVPTVYFEVDGGNANTGNYKVTVNLTGTINPKDITNDNNIVISQETFPVYNGRGQLVKGSLLKVTDDRIKDTQNNSKVLQRGERNDYTVNSIEGTDANEDAAHAADYQLTVTGQGNYTGTKTFNATIKKFVETVEKPLLSTSISRNQVTRGKTTTLYIDTAVLLKDGELGKSGAQVDGKVTWTVEKTTPGATVTVERVENEKKLKVTVEVPNGATPDENNPQIIITLRSKFAESHQNITSGQSCTYNLYVTDKAQQENFKIDQGESGTYSYSKGSLQLTTSGKAEGSTVTWSIADADKVYAEVNANGYVTFKKPTTTGIIITAAASETNDYAAASDTYTLTITKGQVTITASSATMTANDPLPGFSATASGLNPNDSVSEVFQTLTASVSTDGKTAGTFRVTPNAVFKTGVKDWNEYYELSFVQGTLTVNPAVSVIDTVLPTIIAGNGCANGYANCACESFYDLDASRWYHEPVDWAYNLGLMNGTTKSTFGPNAAATRAQTWTMLARIAGQDTRRSSTWYEVGQKWAMNLGITDGTNPMGSLTREQLAAMLYRYVGSPAVNGTLTFTDSANVSTWARNAMIWAVQNGILDGVGGNRLNPKGTTTRAQAAAIFMRFSKLINK